MDALFPLSVPVEVRPVANDVVELKRLLQLAASDAELPVPSLILAFDKPLGMTSFQLVAKVRKSLTLAMGALFIVSVRGGRKIAAEYKTQSHSPANAAGDTANH